MTNIQPPVNHFERPDPVLTNKIVTHLKSQGIFDQFRRECMADVDTKPAYHNLRQRVEGSVAAFLRMNPWRPDMNKNQLRDNLRKHIQSGGFLDIGVDRIVDQVVNPKIYTVFLPKVEEVVQSCLGMENDKPTFEPPPPNINSEPKFQDKHNLAPRGKLPAPLLGPILRPLKPIEKEEGKPLPVEKKPTVTEVETDADETGDKKFVVDEDELGDKEEEDEEDDDDEESPPFEPHSEGDRLILGMRSDSSENSNDSQLVTTIVDDNLEETIDNDETTIKDESDKKDEDSSSDEYVPKTPTINMEESDGTVLEFNSITEYKHYQSKFEEESVGNVEEVVESQTMNDDHEHIKEEESGDQYNSINGSQTRKLNIDSCDDASSSNSDRESTSDEIKPAVFESFMKKRFTVEEYDDENETSELSNNEPENDDSYTEKSLEITYSKLKLLESDTYEKHKGSSTSSKDSGKSYHDHHKESSTQHFSKDKTADENQETRYSHSSKDKKYDKRRDNESSREHHKERDRKISESSSKHNEKETRLHSGEENVKGKERKRNKSTERSNKEKEDHRGNRRDRSHKHKDYHNDNKSQSDYNKDKNKDSSHDRQSEVKEDREIKKSDKRHVSKHKHSSSRHSRSSSEKHRSDKEYKHKGSHDRHKSHDKKSDKDSREEKKRYRQHCKYTSNKDENRRSSDRDSSGPCGSTHKPDSSNSRSSMSNKESKVDSGERTTSNSDNTVSESIEEIVNSSKFDVSNKNSDFQILEDSFNESDPKESEWKSSIEEKDQQQTEQRNRFVGGVINEVYEDSLVCSETVESNKETVDTISPQSQHVVICGNNKNSTEDITDSFEKSTDDVGTDNYQMQDSAISSISLHDSSSEKENAEDEKDQMNSELNTNTNKTLDENSRVLKFKKPKIAKNIHEIKKIMEARRNLKRMEKKRIKLLIKNNFEGYESDDKSSNENKSEDEYQNVSKSSDDESLNDNKADESNNVDFIGFSNKFGEEKKDIYNRLTERLEKDIFELEKLINNEQINTNLVTSWIDLNPNLDNYIENTLNGKVHRKYRIRIPPICDAFYNYDSEQNVYFLVNNWDAPEQKDALVDVDSNLNHLNSGCPDGQQENVTSCYSGLPRISSPNEGSTFCLNSSIINPTLSVNTVIVPEEELASSNAIVNNMINSSVKKIDDSGIIAPPQSVFNITFNQTYDEVLKEKAQNSVVPSKRELEELNKTQCTVVKITNNKTSEQVFMKQIQSNSGDKVQVPRITKSETINGSHDSKCCPLISRITKGKSKFTQSSTKMKHQQANGIVSTNSTTNFKETYPVGVSQKAINDVIGIQNVTFDQGDISDQGSQSGEDVPERKRRRTGCRQQRYDSSDLYKPRLQLSSRRVRAASSPEDTPVLPVVVITRKKRSATTDLNTSSPKSRR